MVDLQWAVPEKSVDENADTGGKCLVFLLLRDMDMHLFRRIENQPEISI